ncbi:MAG: hypothetical protein CLLPBCKN_006515 [Chroococcidiopsis cubana SAG 39.79]|uniref:Uncharacterized protein n=1 Tax=Chroococcidiopsis cubana SAG 39.79 TaxID=388085 RepID=A0AB37UII5_9CYAN|nr:hypothetical protein [Chroococcidiopsis cubana SAG 39.79]RUT11201.1 hypothetical protein DSM107010_34700 [Chroococcidiopsis cubana SAG 39.79]
MSLRLEREPLQYQQAHQLGADRLDSENLISAGQGERTQIYTKYLSGILEQILFLKRK